MAHHSQQVHTLESQKGLPANSRRVQEGRQPRLEHGRRFLLEGTPGCGWWKRVAQSQCIGRSRGGLTTKIHALVDSLGRPLHVHLTAGNIHDVSEAPTLIAAAQGKSFIADKGYDSNAVVDTIKQRRMKVVIPPKSNRSDQRKFSRKLYRTRHFVENFFCNIKRYRRVSTRYEKTATNFLGFILFAAVRVWLA